MIEDGVRRLYAYWCVNMTRGTTAERRILWRTCLLHTLSSCYGCDVSLPLSLRRKDDIDRHLPTHGIKMRGQTFDLAVLVRLHLDSVRRPVATYSGQSRFGPVFAWAELEATVA